MKTTPPLDTRTAATVTGQLQDLLKEHAPDYWLARAADERGADPLGDTLVSIAARFAEIVIQRLNQVPQKHFLAFLDLLGASPRPPQPARVPLTFSLAAGSAVPGVVLAGTQVGAAPAPGDDGPVVFETERELIVLPATLTALYAGTPAAGLPNLAQQPFAPFSGTAEPPRTAFIGFQFLSGAASLAGRPVSLFVDTVTVPFSDVRNEENAVAPRPVKLSWEYWNGAWSALAVRDDTQQLSRSGPLEFLLPHDWQARTDFPAAQYWIRVCWQSGDYAVEPRIARVLVNTTMASHVVTVRDERLGSSDGSKTQTFTATRSPVLPGQCLEVREPEQPSATERAAIESAEGADAITPATDTPAPTDVWVRWHEVPDFHASEPRDRHYVVDHLTARIFFGDGQGGLVPPAGTDNVRLVRYQTGGGRVGNRAAGTIVQLRTTVPYVDKVTNLLPATGGTDAEALDAVGDRVPRELRHGGRAVTIEDFEDLARAASPDVARTKCIPTPPSLEAGSVTVIVVPRSADPKPAPSVELVRRVEDYLDARRSPAARLRVAGPAYVAVNVAAQITPASLDTSVMAVNGIRQALADFLHPVSGGFDGSGWDFGSIPNRSDFYRLFEAVPGVDHVRTLDVSFEPPAPTALVCAGTADITAFFERA